HPALRTQPPAARYASCRLPASAEPRPASGSALAFGLVKRLDEPGQLGRHGRRRAAGGIDDRQAKKPVFLPIPDRVRYAFRLGMQPKAPPTLLVGAVE